MHFMFVALSLLQALETYYHPANSGGHTKALHDFFRDLTSTFVWRVHEERLSRTKKWGNVKRAQSYLTDEDIAEFVSLMKPGLYCM